MTPERQEIAMAVINGQLSADHLTWEEVEEIERRVYDLIIERELEKASESGKIVFSGVEQGVLN